MPILTLLATIASMHGCPSVTAPAVPIRPPAHALRCDPARLGWAADGSLIWQAQQPPASVNLLAPVE